MIRMTHNTVVGICRYVYKTNGERLGFPYPYTSLEAPKMLLTNGYTIRRLDIALEVLLATKRIRP